MSDRNPTKKELMTIADWPNGTGVTGNNSHADLMLFIESIWAGSDVGYWLVKPSKILGKRKIYNIMTGDSKGNADMVRAMEANSLFWSICWMASRRRGHHLFAVNINPPEE